MLREQGPYEALCRKALVFDSDNFLTFRTVPIDTVLGLRALAPGIEVEQESTGRAGGRPDKSSGNTSGKSQTIAH
ncbi:hypothetical protein Tco_1356636 [Tanacetum coccineum]